MATHHTFLVAFQVNGQVERGEAEEALLSMLPRPMSSRKIRRVAPPAEGGEVTWRDTTLECWWVAEDDRHDGSDNDSAVFVNYGSQQDAWKTLISTPDPDPDREGWTLTQECNNPERRSQ
jgi:hypothetical protein